MLGGDFTARSFLRGAQTTDANGAVTFTTILPGRYQGRAFHIHDDALIDALYAQAGYTKALGNETTNAHDSVFSDGVDHELLTMSGTVAAGLAATFTVGI
jgi:hypothetical protein